VQLGGGVGLGLRESDAELKGKFDAAIQSMKDDGSLNAMIKKNTGSAPSSGVMNGKEGLLIL
jgi:polar amino acid transport system substrate-binding protein